MRSEGLVIQFDKDFMFHERNNFHGAIVEFSHGEWPLCHDAIVMRNMGDNGSICKWMYTRLMKRALFNRRM